MKQHNLNLVGLAVNVSRAYEIAKFGGHSINLVPSDTGNVRQADCTLLSKFYGSSLFYNDNPDITIEVCYSPADILQVIGENRYETIEDINKRIAETPKLQVSPKLDKVSQSLLKTACEKLGLGITDTIQIISVAQTIANLSHSETIKVEHLAEAIQYKSIQSN